MSQWEYDRVFYRVLCVTLLAIAFTFTVILTNVFIDIDGLIRNKGKNHNDKLPASSNVLEASPNNMKPEVLYNEEKNYVEEIEDTQYRAKRSSESKDFLLRMKDPRAKNLIKNKLAKLLEEMDAEEADIETSTRKNKPTVIGAKLSPMKETQPAAFKFEQHDVLKNSSPKIPKREEVKVDELANEIINSKSVLNGTPKKNLEIKTPVKSNLKTLDNVAADIEADKESERPSNIDEHNKDNDLLHLTMHNILLQGIVGHMDLGDVYHRINKIVRSYRNNAAEFGKDLNYLTTKKATNMGRRGLVTTGEESNFLNELINCNELRSDIREGVTQKSKPTNKPSIALYDPKLTMNTIIDILSPNRRLSESEIERNIPDATKNEKEISKEEMKGVIKLLYNGRPINLKDIIYNYKSTKNLIDDARLERSTLKQINNLLSNHKNAHSYKHYLKRLLSEYLQNYHEEPETESVSKAEFVNKLQLKRSKRHTNANSSSEFKDTINTNHTKKDEDELYVEIETHFGNKSKNNEKRHKLVKNLIERIQNALQTDIDTLQKKNKIHLHHHLHVKKRLQDSLKPSNNGFKKNKVMIPVDVIIPRHLNPISKSSDYEVVDILTEKGDKLRHPPGNTGLFTLYKSINSAERGEVDVDYKQVLKTNGVPQRLQLPLSHDYSVENNEAMTTENSYADLDNMNLVLKDIDGTGLSIGFNQYVDEMPDPDSIKLFTNLENLVKEYNSKYNNKLESLENKNIDTNEMLNKNEYAISVNQDDSHVIVRRSVNDINNEVLKNPYKTIIENILPSEKTIFKDQRNEEIMNVYKKLKTEKYNQKINPKPYESFKTDFVENEQTNIFNKKLKPTEIFSLANLLKRKKRETDNRYQIFKQIPNLRHVMKRVMPSQRIFFQKKRHKRQVDKIRIITTDTLPDLPHHSDDNIYVVSDEHIFADRALIRDAEASEVIGDKIVDEQNHNHDHYDIITPYVLEEPKINHKSFDYTLFGGKNRHNSLMSRYPHVFMDDIENKDDNQVPEQPSVFNQLIRLADVENEQPNPLKAEYEFITTIKPTFTDYDYSNARKKMLMDELDYTQDPQNDKELYKLTVKVTPRNKSDVHSGFKEVHTSINKSFNKNGLLYYSHVNVSEISKIEKINATTTESTIQLSKKSPVLDKIREQHDKMKILLKQHKERIDQQLKHLHNEREHLADMLFNNTQTLGDDPPPKDNLIDIVLPLNPPQVLHVTKEEASKLLSSAFMKLQESPQINDLSYRSFTTTTIKSTTASYNNPGTEATLIKTTQDPIRSEIIDNIKSNRNLTGEILNKIDRNTEILTTFLKKITDSLHETKIPDPNRLENQPPFMVQEIIKDYRGPHDQVFGQPLPDMDIRKNNTHLSIPFIYAYQHPFNVKDNKNNKRPPIASVLYHGHIHTNAVPKYSNDHWVAGEKRVSEFPYDKPKNANNTTFFMDHVQNYDVVPMKQIVQNDRGLNMTAPAMAPQL